MTVGRRLVLVWLAVVALLGGLLLVAQHARSPLDDPDPARQRPGFLDGVGHPTFAPPVPPGFPRMGRRAVVFFVAPRGAAPLCKAVAADDSLLRRADVLVVSSEPTDACPATGTVVDTAGALARGYGIPRPRDGGLPVGYAVVDEGGRIRYRTLDPTVVDHLGEVETILRAER